MIFKLYKSITVSKFSKIVRDFSFRKSMSGCFKGKSTKMLMLECPKILQNVLYYPLIKG